MANPWTSKSVWKSNSICIDIELSIGVLPYERDFFTSSDLSNSEIRAGRGSSFLPSIAPGLTASPASVYRGDPIEGCLLFFYSVNARGG